MEHELITNNETKYLSENNHRPQNPLLQGFVGVTWDIFSMPLKVSSSQMELAVPEKSIILKVYDEKFSFMKCVLHQALTENKLTFKNSNRQ